MAQKGKNVKTNRNIRRKTSLSLISEDDKEFGSG